MSVNTARFNLLFGVKGQSGLTRVRNDILGVQRITYGASNAMSRSYSAMDKNIMRSSNNIEKSLSGVLTGFKLLGGISLAKMGIGGIVSMAGAMNKAFIHTNQQLQTSKIILEELLGKTNSGNFMDTIQNKSFQFGQDLQESMTASRGLLQVMTQVAAVGGKKVQTKDLDKLLQATMAINTMDTENRSLSFTAFSVKEIMDGNGGMDWTSMRRRNQINIGKENQKKVTALFKKGDLTEGIDLFLKNLDRIGIHSGRLLERMMKENFGTNISRVQGYITMSFQRIGSGIFTSLIRPLAKFNNFVASQFGDGGSLIKEFASMSSKMADFFNPSIDKLITFGGEVRRQSSTIMPLLRQMFGIGADVLSNGGGVFKNFFSGINDGAGGGDGVSSLISGMKMLNILGQGLKNIFYQIQDPVNQLGEAIGEAVKEVAKLLGGGKGNFSNNLATILSGVANGLNGIIRLATLVPKGLNTALGNNEGQTQNSGQNYVNKALDYGMMGLMVAGMFRGRMPKFGMGKKLAVGGIAAEGAMVAEGAAIRNPHIGALETVEARNAQKIFKLNEQITPSGTLNSKNLHEDRLKSLKESTSIRKSEEKIRLLEEKIIKEANRPTIPKRLDQLQNQLQIDKVGLQGKKDNLSTLYSNIESGERTGGLITQRETLSRRNKAIDGRMGMFGEVGQEIGKMGTLEKFLNGVFFTQIFGSFGKGLSNLIPSMGIWIKSLLTGTMTGLASFGSVLAGMAATVFTPLVIAGVAVVAAFGGLTMVLNHYAKLEQEKQDAKYKAQGITMSKKVRDYSDRNNIRNDGVGVKFLQNLFSHGWGGGKIEDMPQFAALWHNRLDQKSKTGLMNVAKDIKRHRISEQGFNNITGNNDSASFMKKLDVIISGELNLTKLDPKVQKTWTEAIVEALRKGATRDATAGVPSNIKIHPDMMQMAHDLNH